MLGVDAAEDVDGEADEAFVRGGGREGERAVRRLVRGRLVLLKTRSFGCGVGGGGGLALGEFSLGARERERVSSPRQNLHEALVERLRGDRVAAVSEDVVERVHEGRLCARGVDAAWDGGG